MPGLLKRALQLPPSFNPKSRQLAESWREEGLSPDEIVKRALTMFREQPFVYTLTPPVSGGHAVDDFLFVTRRGFCEHYAAAFVVVMRALGVPARVVTGYQGAERNELDGTLVVRQSFAHAWAEYWQPGVGWIRADPTAAVAPDRIDRSRPLQAPRGLVAGALDGIAVDEDGNLWCGWGSNGSLDARPEDAPDGVRVFNPQGQAIGHIHLPERCANLCFGGAGRNRNRFDRDDSGARADRQAADSQPDPMKTAFGYIGADSFTKQRQVSSVSACNRRSSILPSFEK